MSRRAPRTPILSMLDLLFGTFGAMIIIALLMTFLRQQEARIEQIKFFYVAAKISTTAGKSGAVEPNLEQLFLEFDLLGDTGSRTWTPDSRPAWSGYEYQTSAAQNAVGGSLLITDIAALKNGALRIGIHNLPTLGFDYEPLGAQGLAPNSLIRISIILKTAFNACAMEVTVPLSNLLSRDAALANVTDANWPGPPSIFEIAQAQRTADGRPNLCTRGPQTDAGSSAPPFLDLEVSDDGRIPVSE